MDEALFHQQEEQIEPVAQRARSEDRGIHVRHIEHLLGLEDPLAQPIQAANEHIGDDDDNDLEDHRGAVRCGAREEDEVDAGRGIRVAAEAEERDGSDERGHHLLTTVGRKSGDKYVFPLFYGDEASSYIIGASKGGAPEHPGWYKNLLANPEVEVQVGTKKIKAKARTTTGAERERLHPPAGRDRRLHVQEQHPGVRRHRSRHVADQHDRPRTAAGPPPVAVDRVARGPQRSSQDPAQIGLVATAPRGAGAARDAGRSPSRELEDQLMGQRQHGIREADLVTETLTPATPQDAVAQIGGPTQTLSEEQIDAFVGEQLASVDLDGRSLCVLVPDGTRSCPLPLLISAVHQAVHGRVTRLTVVVALGTHAAMTEPALAGHLGYPVGGLDERYPGTTVRNHEWWDPATFADVGTIAADRIAELSRGTLHHKADVRINRAVVEHDVTLIVGPVFPHEVVGFSGGNKYLFPGSPAGS